MGIEIIKCVEQLEGTWYYEFYPGEFRESHWGRNSIFLDADAFALVSRVFLARVPGFNPYGPTTISGSIVDNLVEGLRELAIAVARADEPKEVWHADEIDWAGDVIEDWPTTRRDLCQAMHELGRWMLGVKADGEPVSIFGI